MQRDHGRLEALAEAVAKAQPDFDTSSRRVALATYRRFAEGLLSLEDAFELGRLVNAQNFPSLAGERR